MATMKQVYGKVPSLKNERFVNATPTVIVSETALRGPDGTKNPIESLSKLQGALAEPENSSAFQSGNSQLLMDYCDTLRKAYELGEAIKEVYGIIPPKVITDITWKGGDQRITVGLTVN